MNSSKLLVARLCPKGQTSALETVSTTCGSGWVRQQRGALNAQMSAAIEQTSDDSGAVARLRTDPLPQVVLTSSKLSYGLLRQSLVVLFALLMFAGAAVAQDPVPLYPDNYKVLLENDRVRVLDFQLKKGAKEDFHAHPAAVTYVIAPFKIRFTFPDGTTRIREAKAGDVFYGDALTHASENIGDTNAHGLLIEMKAAVKSAPSENDLLTAITFIRGPEGSEQELLNELLSTTAPTRAEPGNLRYDLYQSPTHSNYFMRFEMWRNPQALEDHKMTPHLKASFERRKNKGWMTEITTWKRVSDGTP